MIPKIIYYCWFGERRPDSVQKYIDSWKEKMPNFSIVEINEKTTDLFDLEKELKENIWFKTCYEKQMWAYCSDYVRLKVLYKTGGIYLDTDISLCKSLEGLLNNNKLILGWENKQGINGAVIIAPPKDTHIKDFIEFYNNEIWTTDIYTIPSIIKYNLEKKYKLNHYTQITEYDDILILPPEYFYPMPYKENKPDTYITDNSYTIHWWAASWVAPESLAFLEYKHIYSLDELEIQLPKILVRSGKNSFLQNIFSLKNSYNKEFKIVTFLGIRFKVKRRKKNDTNFYGK